MHWLNRSSNESSIYFCGWCSVSNKCMLLSLKNKDLPFHPNMEMHATHELQNECCQILFAYPTTLNEDIRIIGALLLTHA
jgi:hypothetical protein